MCLQGWAEILSKVTKAFDTMIINKHRRKPVTRTFKRRASGRLTCCDVKSTAKRPRLMTRKPYKPKPLKKDEHPGLPTLSKG